MLFEAIRGRPMGERAQGEIVKWGFVSLLVLMAIIMVNDVTALVQGKLNFKKMEQEAKKKEEEQKDRELKKILNREADSSKEKATDGSKPSVQSDEPAQSNASKETFEAEESGSESDSKSKNSIK